MIELKSTSNIISDSKVLWENNFFQTLSFLQAEELMNQSKLRVKSQTKIIILGLQHKKLITLGRRAQEQQEVYFRNPGYEVVKTSRGGLATLHDEGQLVVYPIMDLKEFKLKPRLYIEILNLTTVNLLKSYGVNSVYESENAGVYTKNGKIAFTGVRIEGGVTSHGISFNIKNDLDQFEQIRSCGVQQPKFDRLKNYDENITLESTFNQWCELFKTELQKQMLS